mgnify:CR=1 FL=1
MSNETAQNYSNLGYTYHLPASAPQENAAYFFTGVPYFSVTNIEVFAPKH